MLLKSVNHVFWLGRYLERLDDTARLINATSHVLIDSHQDTQFGWPILLEVLGQDSVELLQKFQQGETALSLAETERAVMACLINASDSPVSIRATSTAAGSEISDATIMWPTAFGTVFARVVA